MQLDAQSKVKSALMAGAEPEDLNISVCIYCGLPNFLKIISCKVIFNLTIADALNTKIFLLPTEIITFDRLKICELFVIKYFTL